jgi:hypothetical protein
MVDATDVTVNLPPFDGLEPGIFYTGWENSIVGCAWMIRNHAASLDWITANAGRPLLNMGVVGGDRTTVLTFISRLLQYWIDGICITTKTNLQDAAGDMGYGNRAAYSMPRLETGPRITSVFKQYETNNQHSRFIHK